LTHSPIYEQVSGAEPGVPFTPSGLYRLAGYMVNGTFQRARDLRLLTRQQWSRLHTHQDPQSPADLAVSLPGTPRKSRCPMCMGYLDMRQDSTGDIGPCPGCGWHETAAPQPEGERHNPAVVTFSAPDTLTRAVRRQRDPLAEEVPVPVIARAVRVRQRETFAPKVRAPVLHTAAAVSLPCPRCGSKTACPCVPLPPATLEEAVRRRAQALAVHERAMADAGFPAIRKV
jgi:hypothetical protein